MNKEKIEKIWIDIIHSGKGEFEYQLLSKQTIPQLNIGYNKKGQRCKNTKNYLVSATAHLYLGVCLGRYGR